MHVDVHPWSSKSSLEYEYQPAHSAFGNTADAVSERKSDYRQICIDEVKSHQFRR